MSAAAPACQFHSLAPTYGATMEYKETDNCSDIEYRPPFKKPRISGTLPNSGAQVRLINEAITRNFKTQLCRKFRLGHCTLGSRCNYAHGIGELRRYGIVTNEKPLADTFGDDYKMFHERNLCRMFLQGKQCPYEDSCRFLHSKPENTNSRECSMMKMFVTAPAGHDKSGLGQLEFKKIFNMSFDAQVNQKNMMLKTKLCINWETKGYCRYGKFCRFIHAQAEIGKLDGYSAEEYRVLQTSNDTTTNALTSAVAAGPLPKQESSGIKFKFKGNELQKISRIYADWI